MTEGKQSLFSARQRDLIESLRERANGILAGHYKARWTQEDWANDTLALLKIVDALAESEIEWQRRKDRSIAAELREANMLSAVIHVVRYGRLGKQSKRRLKDAMHASREARTHG